MFLRFHNSSKEPDRDARAVVTKTTLTMTTNKPMVIARPVIYLLALDFLVRERRGTRFTAPA
jgi:hypothetical protein